MTEKIKDIAIKSALAECLTHPLELLGTGAHRALLLGRLLRASKDPLAAPVRLGQEAVLLAQCIDEDTAPDYKTPQIVLTWLAHVAPKLSVGLINLIASQAYMPQGEPHPLETIVFRPDINMDPEASVALQLALVRNPKIGPHTLRQIFKKNISDGTSFLAKELINLLPKTFPSPDRHLPNIFVNRSSEIPPEWPAYLRPQYIKAYVSLLEANNLPEEIERRVLKTAMSDMQTSERDEFLRKFIDKPTANYSSILLLAEAMHNNPSMTPYLLGHPALEGNYELTKRLLSKCNASFPLNHPQLTVTMLVASLVKRFTPRPASHQKYYYPPEQPDQRNFLTLGMKDVMTAIFARKSTIKTPIPPEFLKPLLLSPDKDVRILAAGLLSINQEINKSSPIAR